MGPWSNSSRSWNPLAPDDAYPHAPCQKNAVQAGAGTVHSEGETEGEILTDTMHTPP